MIDSMSITDITGQKFDFTIGETPPTPYYPVNKFVCTPGYRSSPQNKMQGHGVWPHPTYMGAGIITIEGNLFGDTFTEFNANYQVLKTIVNPIAGIVSRDNVKTGTLRLKPTGLAQIQTDVAITGWTCEINAASTFEPYQIIWEAFDPFFTQTATGFKVLY